MNDEPKTVFSSLFSISRSSFPLGVGGLHARPFHRHSPRPRRPLASASKIEERMLRYREKKACQGGRSVKRVI